MSREHSTCPKCGSEDIVPILYGFPTPEGFQLADEGKVKLGGCVISDGIPQYHCNACEHQWGKAAILSEMYEE